MPESKAIARLECRTGRWVCKLTRNRLSVDLGPVRLPVAFVYQLALRWLAL